MTLKQTGSAIEVRGIIKTIEDAEKLIDAISSTQGSSIHLKIYDSYVLPSSVIGHLLKMSENGKNVKIGIKDDLLMELISDLNLDKKFAIYKL